MVQVTLIIPTQQPAVGVINLGHRGVVTGRRRGVTVPELVVSHPPHPVAEEVVAVRGGEGATPAGRAEGVPADVHGDGEEEEGQLGEDVGRLVTLQHVQAHGVVAQSVQVVDRPILDS